MNANVSKSQRSKAQRAKTQRSKAQRARAQRLKAQHSEAQRRETQGSQVLGSQAPVSVASASKALGSGSALSQETGSQAPDAPVSEAASLGPANPDPVSNAKPPTFGLAEFHAALGCYLHLPAREVSRLLADNRKFIRHMERYRNQHQSSRQLKKHLDSFSLESSGETIELLSSDRSSRLLVSFHFGDFIYGNNFFASHENNDRKQFFFTQLNPTEAFTSNMRKAFGFTETTGPVQLTIESSSALKLVKKLRTENTTLLTFVDLPRGFGERVKVKFLGRDAWFPKGPAMLALLSRVPILPVLNYQVGDSNRVTAFPLLNSRPEPGRDASEAAQQITQQLVEYLERALVLCPEQWRFLSALPAFFVPDEEEAKP